MSFTVTLFLVFEAFIFMVFPVLFTNLKSCAPKETAASFPDFI